MIYKKAHYIPCPLYLLVPVGGSAGLGKAHGSQRIFNPGQGIRISKQDPIADILSDFVILPEAFSEYVPANHDGGRCNGTAGKNLRNNIS